MDPVFESMSSMTVTVESKLDSGGGWVGGMELVVQAVVDLPTVCDSVGFRSKRH
jgi:hypothetical protein